jgi:hypothetical protein
MSKVKVVERKVTEKETEYDYPIYLYFQGESGDDELVMIVQDFQLKVKWDFLGLSIEKNQGFVIEEHYLKNNLTTKEHFTEMYNEAIESLNLSFKKTENDNK